jgi:hypothetical protein
MTDCSAGLFLVNNYHQALNILKDEAAFKTAMNDLNIMHVGNFEEWLAEEREYLRALSKEPLEETLEMEYYQKLVNLRASE